MNENLWLDDLRPAPEGWDWTMSAEQAIALLKSRQYVLLSLDHDLGNDRAGTGLDVLRWIEEEVVLHGFRPPEMRVHSMNPVGRQNMLAAIDAIQARRNNMKAV